MRMFPQLHQKCIQATLLGLQAIAGDMPRIFFFVDQELNAFLNFAFSN